MGHIHQESSEPSAIHHNNVRRGVRERRGAYPAGSGEDIGTATLNVSMPSPGDSYKVPEGQNKISNSHLDIDIDKVSVGNFQRAEARMFIMKSGRKRREGTHIFYRGPSPRAKPSTRVPGEQAC